MHAPLGALSLGMRRQAYAAWACSAAVPHDFHYSPHMCRAGPERWHSEVAVVALLNRLAHAIRVSLIPMVLEHFPVRRRHIIESDTALLPELCQPPPFAHVGLRSPQLGSVCELRFREARDAATGACYAFLRACSKSKLGLFLLFFPRADKRF